MTVQRRLKSLPSDKNQGVIAWKSPSNIALVKYWGKHGNQLPRNPSLSFTLREAATTTKVLYHPRTNFVEEFSFDFFFENKRNDLFSHRIARYLAKIAIELPFLRELHLRIESSNSFPHSAGIASSASAFSALALCLCTIEDRLYGLTGINHFQIRTSAMARLGSGSACRSLFAHAALWGLTAEVPGSSDFHAVALDHLLHEDFRSYRDSILLLSTEEKQVSSSVGHSLMENHPYADVRYKEAHKNLDKTLSALRGGEFQDLGELCEMEAMQLHALMLCSTPNYILLAPNTIKAIRRVQIFRKENNIPLYFTLDAGPNVHLLYPDIYEVDVHKFIQEELLELCEGKRWIDDRVGSGPQVVETEQV